MKKMKNRILSLLLAAIMVAALAACGGNANQPANSTAPAPSSNSQPSAAEPPQSGNVSTADNLSALANSVTVNPNAGKGIYPGTSEKGAITVECTTMDKMNSILMTYNTELSCARHMWDCLVKLDAENNIVGAAATSWESSDDGMTWTFHLRDGMKWVDKDGKEVGNVTANDFVFAWSELLNPANAAEYYSFATIFKNAQAYYDYASGKEGAPEVKLEDVGFKAVDDLTLQFELETYVPYILQNLKFEVLSPVYQPFYEQVGADKYGTSPDTLLFSGPFRMTSWTLEDTIVMEKNNSWWDAANVSVQKINFVKYTDANTKYNAFVSGEIDLIDTTGDQRGLFAQEGFTVSNYVGGYSFYFYCNTLQEEDVGSEAYPDADLSDMRSVNLRHAIDCALNREQIIATVFKNDNKPSQTMAFGISSADGTKSFSDVVVEANGGKPLYSPTPNADLAKEYLAKALRDLGYTDASQIKLTLLTSTGTQNELMSQVVQEQLRSVLGINADIDVMEIGECRARRNAKKYDMFSGGWGPDYNDPMTDLDLWMTNNGNNHTGYHSAEYDALIESTKTETDPAAREQIFVKAEQLLAQDLPFIPTYWRYEDYVVSEKMASGYVRKPFQGYYLAYTTLAN